MTRKRYPSDKARYERQTAVLRSLKDGPCVDCGIRYPYYVMQFDHVKGVKKFDIGRGGVNRRLEVLMEEIAKCELVCANCHAVRTHLRKQPP